MTDSNDRSNDRAWQQALDWVLRAQERPLDAAAGAALAAWLAEHPSHRAAYDEASRVWLLTGLVPPADDVS
jgi:transmembrane sensor